MSGSSTWLGSSRLSLPWPTLTTKCIISFLYVLSTSSIVIYHVVFCISCYHGLLEFFVLSLFSSFMAVWSIVVAWSFINTWETLLAYLTFWNPGVVHSFRALIYYMKYFKAHGAGEQLKYEFPTRTVYRKCKYQGSVEIVKFDSTWWRYSLYVAIWSSFELKLWCFEAFLDTEALFR